MKRLPDQKTLLEMLEVFKDAEQKAREMSELATAIAFKYQNRMRKIREAADIADIKVAMRLKAIVSE